MSGQGYEGPFIRHILVCKFSYVSRCGPTILYMIPPRFPEDVYCYSSLDRAVSASQSRNRPLSWSKEDLEICRYRSQIVSKDINSSTIKEYWPVVLARMHCPEPSIAPRVVSCKSSLFRFHRDKSLCKIDQIRVLRPTPVKNTKAA